MYEKLIKSLRELSDWSIMDYEDGCAYANSVIKEAADAIAELLSWHNADAREIERQKCLIANVQRVVTCGECKYRHNIWRQGCQGRRKDWFCADGERLTNGVDMRREQT